MNIFVVDSDPFTAARSLCDKHVVKMVLETAQILCTALRAHGVLDTPYKATHAKHPCTLWAGQSRDNFLWLVEHGLALGQEYTWRYGKVHKSAAVVEHCLWLASQIPEGPLTAFAQAMPEQYRRPCAVSAYRAYYKGEKARIATWKRPAEPPAWYSTCSPSLLPACARTSLPS